jgi:hypothetical protein
MARPNDEFGLAWRSLSEDRLAQGWRTIPIAPAGPCRMSAGRRFPGNQEAVLFSFPTLGIPAAAALPEGQGFAVERVDPIGDGGSWLALARQASGAMDIFEAMVCDVAGALDAQAAVSPDEAKLLRVLLGRARAWQEFMRKGAGALSPEAEIGLIGELVALRSIIDAGVPAAQACDSWVGPKRGVRDFELGTGGIEIKAALSAIGFMARVGSLDQLDDTARQPLFIAAVRIRQSEDGAGLPDRVEDFRDLVRGDAEAERLFGERLLAAGYIDRHASKYTRRFAIANMKVIEVQEGFPRLTRSRVPSAITWANYEIDLDKAPGKDVVISEALRRLGVI